MRRSKFLWLQDFKWKRVVHSISGIQTVGCSYYSPNVPLPYNTNGPKGGGRESSTLYLSIIYLYCLSLFSLSE